MPSSDSHHSKSSRSQSPKNRSESKSEQKRNSKSRSKSNERKKRSRSAEDRRSPGKGIRRNPDLIPKSAKLFVTNIDSSINADELKTDLQKEFTRFGKIKQINIKTKRESKNSFAFLQYQKVEQAEAAMTQMRGKMFKGKQLKVQFGKGERKQQDRRADKCYICHKEGHFAKDCHYRDRSRDVPRRDYESRRRYSRSSSSSRSPRRRRSYERDYRKRDYRRSPDRRRERDYYERRPRY